MLVPHRTSPVVPSNLAAALNASPSALAMVPPATTFPSASTATPRATLSSPAGPTVATHAWAAVAKPREQQERDGACP
jgi:hypothetical protein